MISYLKGQLVHSLPTQVEIEVAGVGYELLIPLSTFDRLPLPPAPVTLLTHLQVREDAHILYGFASAEERDLFRLLIHHVSGVGPRIALAVISGMSVPAFRAAVVGNDITGISRIKGVGKKTAEKIIVELRDKVGVSQAWEYSSRVVSTPGAADDGQQSINDATLALLALGYKQAEAQNAVLKVRARLGGGTVEDLVREALKQI